MNILGSLILVTLMSSCNENIAELEAPEVVNPNGKLISSYVVDDKWESSYSYNNDNTLKEIVFKTDGVLQYTETFTYENGKIVEAFKQDTNGANSQKKQFEYKGNLIVKERVYLNGELSETSEFSYTNDNFLEKIITKVTNNSLETTKTTTIEKFVGENKIKVTRTNVATHIISYDDKLTPLAAIPGYKPLVQIDHHGIAGNILLTEIFVGNKRTTTVATTITFGDDNKTVLSAKTTFKSKNLLETQEFKYTY